MRREPTASSRKAQSEIGQDGKYWRLVEPYGNGFADLEWYLPTMDKWITGLQIVEINPSPARWKIKEVTSRHMKVIINALILANALDYSALSKETCEALRGLGVKIP